MSEELMFDMDQGEATPGPHDARGPPRPRGADGGAHGHLSQSSVPEEMEFEDAITFDSVAAMDHMAPTPAAAAVAAMAESNANMGIEVAPMQEEPNFDPIDELRRPVLDFLVSTPCYNMMPVSSKVVVFDVELPVKEAFHVAYDHSITFATLWDSVQKKFVGMLTVTDFIDILLHFNSKPNALSLLHELEGHHIRAWRGMGQRNRPHALVYVTPRHSLYDAVRTLRQHRIHRLPVMHDNSALLYIATFEAVLEYMYRHIDKTLPVWRKTIAELQLGTFSASMIVATRDMTLQQVLQLLKEKSISALPVVNPETRELEDIYSRTDVMYLAAARKYDLSISLNEALAYRPTIGHILTCEPSETLGDALDRLVTGRVHRLVTLNEKKQVIGVISITDIFNFFLSGL